MRLATSGFESFLHLLGLLDEAGIPVLSHHGGNELSVPDDATVDDPGLRAEIAASLRPGTLPATFASLPPGGGDAPAPGTGSAREQDDLPPRAGRGSGRDAWATAAARRGLTVTDDMTRDQIIELLEGTDGR